MYTACVKGPDKGKILEVSGYSSNSIFTEEGEKSYSHWVLLYSCKNIARGMYVFCINANDTRCLTEVKRYRVMGVHEDWIDVSTGGAFHKNRFAHVPFQLL